MMYKPITGLVQYQFKLYYHNWIKSGIYKMENTFLYHKVVMLSNESSYSLFNPLKNKLNNHALLGSNGFIFPAT